jgi:carbamoyl-phosphate synthase large subunit
MKLLITGAQGDIADSLCRIAHSAWPGCVVHGADALRDPWPLANGFAALHCLPPGDAGNYVAELADLQSREQFDAVVPVTDGELWALSGNRPCDMPLIAVADSWLRRSLDKAATAPWLESCGLPAPRTTLLSAASARDLPVIVKPRHGHGSRGLEVVRTAERLAAVQLERSDEAIAQQYVSDADSEFTCGVFRDRRSGETRTVVFRRILQGGLTGRATVEKVDSIDQLLRQIAVAGDLDGSINVQLRLGETGPLVFEINPRFSSTVMMRHRIGFSDFVWSIQSRLHGTPPGEWVAPTGTRIFRLSRELVLAPPAAALQ